MPSWIQSVDAKIVLALSGWNFWTTVLALLIAFVTAYPIFFPSEPDTHPLLLARQSVPAPVRKRGESAQYRVSEVPHGYPLKSGLAVRDPGIPRWSSGRDGDLRDVWREVASAGGVGADGREIPRGLIMTVLGRDIVEREIEELSTEIDVIGSHLKAGKVTKVAIYLPNSIEYLLAIFGELMAGSGLPAFESLMNLKRAPSMAFLPFCYHTTSHTTKSTISSSRQAQMR